MRKWPPACGRKPGRLLDAPPAWMERAAQGKEGREVGKYKTPAQRMEVSLRREEAEATGKPLYSYYADVPPGLWSKTVCALKKRPVAADEAPAAYVLNRNWLGYLPLYSRPEE